MYSDLKEIIVISAINIRSGGTLTILRQCLSYLNDNLTNKYKIIALVHKKDLFQEYGNIHFIEFPYSIKSYLLRCYYEYFEFFKISRQLKPYLWLSLLDSTPNVLSKIRAVYCHNPSPFYHYGAYNSSLMSLKSLFYTFFYKYFYKINIKKNDYVIVQQSWLREKFCELFKLKRNKIIVAYPDNKMLSNIQIPEKCKNGKKYVLFYPSFPRVFKNFEIICKAAMILEKRGCDDFDFILTIDGSENKYSRFIYETYKNLKNIKFIGLQSFEKTQEIYSNCDCLVFPSKLETWGLPITEAQKYNLPMLLADLPYAHETLGDYKKVSFFDPDSPERLVESILRHAKRKIYDGNIAKKIEQPFTTNWQELFKILLAKA